MSDKNHTNEIKHQYWIDEEMSKKLEKKLENLGYKNRSEWYREQVRKTLEKK